MAELAKPSAGSRHGIVDGSDKAAPFLQGQDEVVPQSPCLYGELNKDQQKALKKTFAWHELGFTVGVFNFGLTAFVIGRFPALMWVLHVAKVFIYMPWRYVRFKKWNGQLYLLEFCYFVTYVTTVCVLLPCVKVILGVASPLEDAPIAAGLFKTGFCFSTGTLATSAILFRNAIVFHDIDKLTSTFVHLSPALVFWCLRWGGGLGTKVIEDWWGDMFQICPEAHNPCITGMMTQFWCWEYTGSLFWDFIAIPMAYYLCLWSIPYSLLMFCLLPNWIKRHEMDTFYIWSTRNTDGSKKSCWVTGFPEPFWPIAYMGQHFAFAFVCNLLSYPMWHSFWLHTLFVVGLILVTIHNGASYTFKVFATGYTKQQLERHPSVLLS